MSYIVSVETVDNLAGYFQLVRNPIDSSPEVADFLLVALQFLSSLTGRIISFFFSVDVGYFSKESHATSLEFKFICLIIF